MIAESNDSGGVDRTVGPANSFCEVHFFTWENDAKGQIELETLRYSRTVRFA